MAKKQKRLTKRERKAAGGAEPHQHHHQHIHCIACGRHLDAEEFTSSPSTARHITCQHGSTFPVCSGCVENGQELLREHDRTGRPVQSAGAWH